jgi:gas vesicle protein
MLTGLGAAAALLSRPRRGRAAAQPESVSAKGPILYRRTAETERYYRTLYQ